MRFLLSLPLLVVLVVAYPHSSEENDPTIIDTDFYPESLIVYEGDHDIVDIMIPLNSASINGYESYESHSAEISQLKQRLMVFFIEADINDDKREEHGIYLYRNGKVNKVMDEGRAMAAAADYSDQVFFGAKDGLYVYNPDTQKADKYGNFDDSIKDMAKEQNNDVIYILTDERELYRVYETATKKEKVDNVKDAEQIMIDYSNNLYYYGKDNKLYVLTVDGETKEIEGLPAQSKDVKLVRPAMFNNDGVAVMVDNTMYNIYSDGRSEAENVEFIAEAKPSAYSMEAGIFRYIGYKKKIYEYDILSMIDSSESTAGPKALSQVILIR